MAEAAPRLLPAEPLLPIEPLLPGDPLLPTFPWPPTHPARARATAAAEAASSAGVGSLYADQEGEASAHSVTSGPDWHCQLAALGEMLFGEPFLPSGEGLHALGEPPECGERLECTPECMLAGREPPERTLGESPPVVGQESLRTGSLAETSPCSCSRVDQALRRVVDGHEERLGERVLVSGCWLDVRP